MIELSRLSAQPRIVIRLVIFLALHAVSCQRDTQQMQVKSKKGTGCPEVPKDDQKSTWPSFEGERSHPGLGRDEKVRTDTEAEAQEPPRRSEFATQNTTTAAHYGLRIHPIDRDGNCLFRAVADQLQKPPYNIRFSERCDYHSVVRQLAVHHLGTHRAAYCSFFPNDNFKDVDEWLAEMSQEQTWGGEIAIHALSDALQLTVVAIRAEASDKEAPHIYRPIQSQGSIHLHYRDGNHYESLHRDYNLQPIKDLEALIRTQPISSGSIDAQPPNLQVLIDGITESLCKDQKQPIVTTHQRLVAACRQGAEQVATEIEQLLNATQEPSIDIAQPIVVVAQKEARYLPLILEAVFDVYDNLSWDNESQKPKLISIFRQVAKLVNAQELRERLEKVLEEEDWMNEEAVKEALGKLKERTTPAKPIILTEALRKAEALLEKCQSADESTRAKATHDLIALAEAAPSQEMVAMLIETCEKTDATSCVRIAAARVLRVLLKLYIKYQEPNAISNSVKCRRIRSCMKVQEVIIRTFAELRTVAPTARNFRLLLETVCSHHSVKVQKSAAKALLKLVKKVPTAKNRDALIQAYNAKVSTEARKAILTALVELHELVPTIAIHEVVMKACRAVSHEVRRLAMQAFSKLAMDKVDQVRDCKLGIRAQNKSTITKDVESIAKACRHSKGKILKNHAQALLKLVRRAPTAKNRDTLIKAFNDFSNINAKIRGAILKALIALDQAFPTAESFRAIIKACKDPSNKVRKVAVKAIIDRHRVQPTPENRGIIKQACNDTNLKISQLAKQALAEMSEVDIKHEHHEAATSSYEDADVKAQEEVLEDSEEVDEIDAAEQDIASIIQACRNSSSKSRKTAIELLTTRIKAAPTAENQDAMLKACANDNAAIQAAGTIGLAVLTQAMPSLANVETQQVQVNACEHIDWQVRKASLEALAAMIEARVVGDEQQVKEVILKLCKDECPPVRHAATRALNTLIEGNPTHIDKQVYEMLILLCSDKHVLVRTATTHVLTTLIDVNPTYADKQVYDILIRLCADTSGSVQDAVRRALVAFSKVYPAAPMRDMLLSSCRDINRCVRETTTATLLELIKRSPACANRVLRNTVLYMCADAARWVRYNAILILLELCKVDAAYLNHQVKRALQKALIDIEPGVQEAAAHACSALKLSSANGKSTYADTSKKRTKAARKALEDSVKATPRDKALETIVEAFTDANPYIRAAAARMVRKRVYSNSAYANDQLRDSILAACQDPHINVRIAATYALAAIICANPLCANEQVRDVMLKACGDYTQWAHKAALYTLLALFKADAARANEEALNAVLKACQASSWHVRITATRLLFELLKANIACLNQQAYDAVATLCKDPAAEVQTVANNLLIALAQSHPTPPVLGTLAKVYKDADVKTQADIFKKIPIGALPSLLTVCKESRTVQAILTELVTANPTEETREILMKACQDEHAHVRTAARYVLVEFAKDAPIPVQVVPEMLTILIEICVDADEGSQKALTPTLLKLAKTNPANSLETLVKACSDPKYRAIAAHTFLSTIQKIPTSVAIEVIPTLLVLCQYDDLHKKSSTVLTELIKANATEATQEVIMKACGDANANVQASAFGALAALAQTQPGCVNQQVLNIILRFCQHEAEWCREAAMQTLTKLISTGKYTNKQVLNVVTDACQAESVYVGHTAMLALSKLIEARSAYANKKLLSIILKGSRSTNAHMRHASMLALGELLKVQPTYVSKSVQNAIIQACDDEDEYVRHAAVLAFGTCIQAKAEYTNKRARTIMMLKACQDSDKHVRQAAIPIFVKLVAFVSTQEFVQILPILLNLYGEDNTDEVHEQITLTLLKLVKAHSTAQVQPILIKASQAPSPYTCAAALRVLREFVENNAKYANKEVLQVVLKACEDEDAYVCYEAMRTLAILISNHAAYANRQAKEAIIHTAEDEDPHIRYAAMLAALKWVKVCPASVDEELQKILNNTVKDEDQHVQVVARSALQMYKASSKEMKR